MNILIILRQADVLRWILKKNVIFKLSTNFETSVVIQWFETSLSLNAGGAGSIAGGGAKIPHASQPKNSDIGQTIL